MLNSLLWLKHRAAYYGHERNALGGKFHGSMYVSEDVRGGGEAWEASVNARAKALEASVNASCQNRA